MQASFISSEKFSRLGHVSTGLIKSVFDGGSLGLGDDFIEGGLFRR
jgi:hypothetical protein